MGGRLNVLLLTLLLPTGLLPAQSVFRAGGTVVDARTGTALGTSRVVVMGIGSTLQRVVMTDEAGAFRLNLSEPSRLLAEHPGYASAERVVTGPDTTILIALYPLGSDVTRRETAQTLERLTITAVRGGADAPIAEVTLDRARLERDYSGQDIPLTLRSAPSVTAYSESGSLLNYSYFRLRGIDQSRINVTLDGVPLNEPEDQQIYFSDFPDLTSSIGSVQVQRGVGTSTYGQAAYGGSINFASKSLLATSRGASVSLGGGSFGTARFSVEGQGGSTDGRLAASGRLSGMRSSGYRDGASSAANSVFLSAGYFGDRDLLKATATTGLERNGQAYEPIPLDELRVNPRFNPLAGVGDHYRESMVSVNYTRLISQTTSAGVTAYGFDTRGWYDYPSGAPGPALRYRSSSRWGGLVLAMHRVSGAVTIDAGAHGMSYAKKHEFDDRPDLQYPGYSNTGHKTEASMFGKVRVELGRAALFGDMQVRTAEFRYEPTVGYGLGESSQRWNFVNPRVGLNFRAGSVLSFFASYGTTGREPTRGDLFAGADDVTPDDAPALLPMDRVRPEYVNDLEAGATITLPRLSATVTLYDMRFRDEIARTGATTPLGYDLRANVGRSYRRGLEVDGSVLLARSLELGFTGSWARARISAYTDESSGTTYRNVAPILTPAFQVSHRITWGPAGAWRLTADGRYQSRTSLAPHGDPELTAPPFFVLDGGVAFDFSGRTLTLQIRNVLNRFALPSGDVSGGEARYFVLAPRSLDVMMRVPLVWR